MNRCLAHASLAHSEEIKQRFDPDGRFNPGKIVYPPRMDDRNLFRFKPDYRTTSLTTGLDWSSWGGFPGAVEMCNNNGACRKTTGAVMCPSFRITGDEKHVTRGRANTLRLALSGQLGPDALFDDQMAESLSLCVSCKACRRECPTGVDMARMKIEVLHQRAQRQGPTLRERLVSELPRYAPIASRLAPIMNLRNRVPALASLLERIAAIDARRSLPTWRGKTALGELEKANAVHVAAAQADVVLFVDTFTNYFEPENALAAHRVLEAAGYSVAIARASISQRPLCCGRTYLAAGRLDRARAEADRLIDAVAPHLERGTPIVGLEPSCLLGMRDEYLGLVNGDRVKALAENSLLLEEFLAREKDAGRLNLALGALPESVALVHGHCHQKSFAVVPDLLRVTRFIPRLRVEPIESSCCGMAGAFGIEREHYDASLEMAEAALLPAVRAADGNTLVVANGTSCRHQIADGSDRQAVHIARVLDAGLQSLREAP